MFYGQLLPAAECAPRPSGIASFSGCSRRELPAIELALRGCFQKHVPGMDRPTALDPAGPRRPCGCRLLPTARIVVRSDALSTARRCIVIKRLTMWHARPEVPREEAVHHWLSGHLPLVVAVPGVRRYVQNRGVQVPGGDEPPTPDWAKSGSTAWRPRLRRKRHRSGRRSLPTRRRSWTSIG